MALGRFEEDITRHKLILTDLQTQKNSYAFISRLPNEILTTIFIYCARDYHYDRDQSPSETPPSWVNVSYVCRRWRNVALNFPALWSYVFITSQRWTEELLARSKQVSLKICVNFRYFFESRWLDALEKVFDHIERIQELRLDLSTAFANHVLAKLSSRAPRLENLKIWVDHLDTPVEWPSVLFDGDTPVLRTLDLAHCMVPLLKLSALTTLALSQPPAPFQQNMGEFFSMLIHMKNLKHLYLDRVLASATGFLSSAAFRTFEKINLPNLSRLLIAAPLSAVVALLACARIPLKTEVRLKWDSEPESYLDDYASLCSLLARRYSMVENGTPSNQAICSLILSTEPDYGPILAFSASKRHDGFPSFLCTSDAWDCNVPLQIVLGDSEPNTDRIISDICRAMPSRDIESLHVSYPPFSPTFWKTLLGHLKGLRHIELSSGNMPDLSMLSSPSPSSEEDAQVDDRGQDHIFVPRLEKLQLNWIIFSSGIVLYSSSWDPLGGPAMSYACLASTLASRRGTQGHASLLECQMGGSSRFTLRASWGDGELRVGPTDNSFAY